MRFHIEALELLKGSGLLERPEVRERELHLPDWLIELQVPGGRTELEQALGVALPESLWELWSTSPLLCLLDAWRDLAFTSHALLSGPEVWIWEGVNYIEFALEGSGESRLVEANGDADPPVWHGFLDPEPARASGNRLSAFILAQVEEGIQREGVQKEGKITRHHRCYSYAVRLVPVPGGSIEDEVEINAYPGQSVPVLAAERYPDRQVLSIRRQRRFI